MGLARSTARYQPAVRDVEDSVRALVELAGVNPGIGYQQLYKRLRRAGFKINHKRVYRLYIELRLERRKKRARRRGVSAGRPEDPTKVNLMWAMDFMAERLNNGRAYRLFAVLDRVSRGCLTIDVNSSMPATRVVAVLNRLAAVHGLPDVLVCDNGPEFRSYALQMWAKRNGVRIHYIDPGKPTQNAFVESFNGTFRNECLDLRDVDTIKEARAIVEAWRRDYNEDRPHGSLGDLSPKEFAERTSCIEFRGLVDPRATRGDNLRLMEKVENAKGAFPTFPQALPLS